MSASLALGALHAKRRDLLMYASMIFGMALHRSWLLLGARC